MHLPSARHQPETTTGKIDTFAGQNKLKLVALCRDSGSYRRYLSQEYAIYKLFNLLSEHSFRARMLEVTYRDSEGRRRDAVQPAFFIESDKEAAERLEMTTVTLFNENRTAIEDLFRDRDGSSDNKKALKYLRDFYEIVNDPKKRQNKIVNACQGKPKP